MSVTKATQILKNAVIVTKTVDTGQTATKGYGLVRSTDDDHVDDAGANGNAYCVALESGAALATIQVALLTGGAVIPVKVGTGGATQGAYATMAADGWTDITLGGGTVVKYVGGKFLNSGAAGDIVGLIAGQFAGGTA